MSVQIAVQFGKVKVMLKVPTEFIISLLLLLV